jgi:hypothetical protein
MSAVTIAHLFGFQKKEKQSVNTIAAPSTSGAAAFQQKQRPAPTVTP